jgi:hypothetical protein
MKGPPRVLPSLIDDASDVAGDGLSPVSPTHAASSPLHKRRTSGTKANYLAPSSTASVDGRRKSISTNLPEPSKVAPSAQKLRDSFQLMFYYQMGCKAHPSSSSKSRDAWMWFHIIGSITGMILRSVFAAHALDSDPDVGLRPTAPLFQLLQFLACMNCLS